MKNLTFKTFNRLVELEALEILCIFPHWRRRGRIYTPGYIRLKRRFVVKEVGSWRLVLWLLHEGEEFDWYFVIDSIYNSLEIGIQHKLMMLGVFVWIDVGAR